MPLSSFVQLRDTGSFVTHVAIVEAHSDAAQKRDFQRGAWTGIDHWPDRHNTIIWVGRVDLDTRVGDPWHFGADPDLTLDLTPYFSDFKDAKKNRLFFITFRWHIILCLKNLILATILC